MSNYPKWWDQTITIYNKYEDSTGRITWYNHTLSNCFWKDTDNLITTGETAVRTNETICRVPVNENFREKYIWDGLGAYRANFFTFGIGDIIIRGNVSDVVNEYESGKRSSDLLTKYKRLQGCFVIDRCTINVGSGRGLEHYYIRGV